MIRISISDVDEAQDDIFRACISAAQDINRATNEDVEILYDGEKIVETYTDYIPESLDYGTFTHYCHPRFSKYMED